MSTPHTDGDWIAKHSDDYAVPVIITCNGEHIATAESIGHREEMNANAQLIASAPELLDALKDLSAWSRLFLLGECRDEDLNDSITDAKRAIDKAIKKP